MPQEYLCMYICVLECVFLHLLFELLLWKGTAVGIVFRQSLSNDVLLEPFEPLCECWARPSHRHVCWGNQKNGVSTFSSEERARVGLWHEPWVVVAVTIILEYYLTIEVGLTVVQLWPAIIRPKTGNSSWWERQHKQYMNTQCYGGYC